MFILNTIVSSRIPWGLLHATAHGLAYQRKLVPKEVKDFSIPFKYRFDDVGVVKENALLVNHSGVRKYGLFVSFELDGVKSEAIWDPVEKTGLITIEDANKRIGLIVDTDGEIVGKTIFDDKPIRLEDETIFDTSEFLDKHLEILWKLQCIGIIH